MIPRRASSRSLLAAVAMAVLALVIPSPLDRLVFGLLGLGWVGLSRAQLRDEQRAAQLDAEWQLRRAARRVAHRPRCAESDCTTDCGRCKGQR